MSTLLLVDDVVDKVLRDKRETEEESKDRFGRRKADNCVIFGERLGKAFNVLNVTAGN